MNNDGKMITMSWAKCHLFKATNAESTATASSASAAPFYSTPRSKVAAANWQSSSTWQQKCSIRPLKNLKTHGTSDTYTYVCVYAYVYVYACVYIYIYVYHVKQAKSRCNTKIVLFPGAQLQNNKIIRLLRVVVVPNLNVFQAHGLPIRLFTSW